MPRSCTLIINPTSGSYSASLVDRVTARLAAAGFSPSVLLTGGPDDAAAFAARACAEEDHPFIVAGGGDGTMNGVINGLVPGRATLAFLPLGTANVCARELGIGSVDEAVRRIIRREARPLSVGLLEGFGVSRRFFLMAGAGFDGFVVEGVLGEEKKRFGKGAYLLSALRTLSAWDGRPMEVEAAGARRSCHSVIVCNAARYGGSFVLAPGASLFEPRFRVVCVEAGRRRDYLRLALRVAAGRGAAGAGVTVFDADTVTIGGNKAVQVDGDFICHGPVTIRSLPDFARLVV
ncbi:diacylglycerol kinase catalytic region [Geobacter metallireducens RCH3]|uniref:Sphingosine/diacylglycerol kinase-related protein n=1 Tax=Geobacter metallireducens (strain ATCC 53774 / DSM 7210 / GS-15) TaxID=269799 RepID=Q39S15_GEOMG|nr:diacylglycerol kinase family protein [Geobacter metallireducens]ABB32959.1 sphingosine/diacylglycerol kinase-related protein [Geobacter metallireducens GS-15]EHP88905.1 diacylglycerol kinase catalytic region [Geobacter metallireducens RCH3]